MDREAVIASVEGSRRVRRWKREEVGEAKRKEGGPLGDRAGYLLNIAVRAYPDDSFRAIPCIFSLCRQIRSTRLVDQPVVLSWRSKLGGPVVMILGKGTSGGRVQTVELLVRMVEEFLQ